MGGSSYISLGHHGADGSRRCISENRSSEWISFKCSLVRNRRSILVCFECGEQLHLCRCHMREIKPPCAGGEHDTCKYNNCACGCHNKEDKSVAAAPAPAVMVTRSWKGEHKKGILTLAAVVILIWAWCSVSESAKQEEQERPAVISSIQQRYTPSPRWLSLHPDTQHGNWWALKDPNECTETKNCWRVIYSVNVMPNSEAKEITCEWLINMDTMQTRPLNTEASTLFYEK